MNSDPETLILDILRFYKNGSAGNAIVPIKLLEANSYNQGIMEILKLIILPPYESREVQENDE